MAIQQAHKAIGQGILISAIDQGKIQALTVCSIAVPKMAGGVYGEKRDAWKEPSFRTLGRASNPIFCVCACITTPSSCTCCVLYRPSTPRVSGFRVSLDSIPSANQKVHTAYNLRPYCYYVLFSAFLHGPL